MEGKIDLVRAKTTSNPDGIPGIAKIENGPVDFAVITALKSSATRHSDGSTKDTVSYRRTTSR